MLIVEKIAQLEAKIGKDELRARIYDKRSPKGDILMPQISAILDIYDEIFSQQSEV